ncbi:MAG: sulfatase-like hydrolase/transferase [Rikenellaceae bacterium]
MKKLALILPSLFVIPMSQAQQTNTQPNVVLIMCDDLGWGDVGFNGNEVIQTPNLDGMASRGMKFNRFYTGCSVSSPTRASVLTGRNPYRMGVFDANAGILREEEVTISELLQGEGYATGHFGKWHLGSLTHTQTDANRGREGNVAEYNPPSGHGYDDAFVAESKVPTWDPMKKPLNANTTGWNALGEDEPFVHYGTHYWDIDGNVVSDNLDGDNSRVIMDRVLPFIERSLQSEKPFLAVVWFHTPHKPCVAGEQYAQMYEGYNEDFRNYAGCITAMDDQVGRLQQFLEQQGVDDNTMIWFCSDNGPEECSENGGGVTGGFRERKRSLHEGGVRVPAFVVWGDRIAQGGETDFPAITSDYLPSIMSAIGISSSKAPYLLDGVDLMDVVRGNEMMRNKPMVTCYGNRTSYTDDRYKIIFKGEVMECYDLIEDPFEKTPLKEIPQLNEKLDYLQATLESYQKSFEGAEYGTASCEKLPQKWNAKQTRDYQKYKN